MKKRKNAHIHAVARLTDIGEMTESMAAYCIIGKHYPLGYACRSAGVYLHKAAELISSFGYARHPE